jgi:hypothetical protein
MERQIGAVEREGTYLSFVCIAIITPIGVFEYPLFCFTTIPSLIA